MLETEALTKRFGGLTAVDDVSMRLLADEIVGLMGPNGSGKTTFINCVSGVYDVTSGTVRYKDEDVTGRKVYKNARDGLARTFQTPRVFDDLTAMENVEVPLLNTDLDTETITRRAERELAAVELTEVSELTARELSGGQKKLLEFARNVVRDPDLILMDEPFAGVHPEIKETMFDRIGELHADGTGFLVVSHEVESLYSISDRIIVFDQGERIASGPPDAIQNDDRVVEAYLGEIALV
jgi:branched-chain amino acid transport system ATP-binding protein